MLNVKNNRLNYGELLTPPKGYKLVKAIGTTYSLDLYALLALPVAMIYSKDMEGNFSQNRYDVLDAIRMSQDKIDIFCQRGKIQVPIKYNSLLAFMEKSIIEITPPSFSSSFHPKIWVIKFSNKEESIFRILVLSRNLTFDRSWDIALHTEGKLESITNKNTVQLADYLRHFYEVSGRDYDPEFFNELSRIKFQNPDAFNDLKFYPILNSKDKSKTFPHPLTNRKFDELMIISPFIDKTTIFNFKDNSRNITLISRQEELDNIDPDVLENIEVYCLNPLVVSGEDNLGENTDIPSSQNLHAKIFIGRIGKFSEWFTGSANCTRPAFERNSEFLVKLVSNHRNSEIKTIKKVLLEDQENLFQKYIRVEGRNNEDEKKLNLILRKLIHHLGLGTYKAIITKNLDTSNYDVKINSKTENDEYDDFEIKLSLIHRKNEEYTLDIGTEQSFIFSNVSLVNISKFLILSIYFKGERQCNIALKLIVDIPEERENVIFKNLINNKIKFYQYLQFILSPEDFSESLIIDDENSNAENNIHTKSSTIQFRPPIYENLLLASSRNPEKLKEVNSIVERLEKIDSEIVQDFKPIWEVFKEFAYVK